MPKFIYRAAKSNFPSEGFSGATLLAMIPVLAILYFADPSFFLFPWNRTADKHSVLAGPGGADRRRRFRIGE
jgi:hypothetical protein